MKLAESSLLLCGDRLLGDDQKVAVAVEITSPERKRPGQVRTDEVLSQDRLDASQQLSQQFVEFWKGRRRRRRDPPPKPT